MTKQNKYNCMGGTESLSELDLEIKRLYDSVPRQSSSRNSYGSLIEQLLESIKAQSKYSWSEGITSKFKSTFLTSFESIWQQEKDLFYTTLLRKCKVTSIGKSQEYFYKHVATGWDISECSPAKAINESIIMECEVERKVLQKEDFLPLFAKVTERTRVKQIQRQIETSSVIISEAIFIERVREDEQAKVYEMVCFYRNFAENLQELCASNTMLACPLKHFLSIYILKVKKKKIRSNLIKSKGDSKLNESSSNVALHIPKILLTPKGEQIRKKREYNNNILLTEVRCFTEAYTEFLWKYLELFCVAETPLDRLVTIETLYGICLKLVWSQVGWIGRRGFEYEDYLLEEYYKDKTNVLSKKINIKDRGHLIRVLQTLENESNPQKYLKKIVLFYREVNKTCQSADDLLAIYENIIIEAIQNGAAQRLGLFRMTNIIEKILKIEQCDASCGEISYAWATFCVLLGLFKENIQKSIPKQIKLSPEQLQTVIHSDMCEYEEIMLDDDRNPQTQNEQL